MSNKYILIDGDDTLWEENLYFRQLVQDVASFLASHNGSTFDACLNQLINQLSAEHSPLISSNKSGVNVLIEALLLASYPMLDTFLHSTLKQHLEQKRVWLKEHPIILKNGVRESMQILSEVFHCVFYSQGDHDIQLNKLIRSDLTFLFDDVLIIQNKTKQVLQDYLTDKRISTRDVVIVGNSPRYDINPARELGISTVYIKSPMTWRRDLVPIIESEAHFEQTENFSDILPFIYSIFSPD